MLAQVVAGLAGAFDLLLEPGILHPLKDQQLLLVSGPLLRLALEPKGLQGSYEHIVDHKDHDEKA